MELTDVLGTALSGVAGGILRLAPEVIKLLDRKNERRHELALQDRQIELTKMQQSHAMAKAEIEASSVQFATWTQAIKEAYSGQFKDTGIPWVNAMSSLVRPLWTYMFLGMWAMVKYATWLQLVGQGISWDQAILTLWGTDDQMVMSALLTFWFLDRSLKYQPIR